MHDTPSSNTKPTPAMLLKVPQHPLPFVITCGDVGVVAGHEWLFFILSLLSLVS